MFLGTISAVRSRSEEAIMRKRLITFAVVGFALYFMFTSPEEAAGLVQSTFRATGALLQALAESLTRFFQTL